MRRKAAYKPDPGSPLGRAFNSFHKKIQGKTGALDSPRSAMLRGKRWYPPEVDPLASGKANNPESWYLGNLWIFCWLPFDMYKNFTDLKSMRCIHEGCTKCHGLESHKYDWRPMFDFDKIVWLYHRRLRCLDCGRTFAEIHPLLLSQLPTRVAERFPFVTTPSGPGMHEGVVYAFANLFTKRVMFGQFASMINELHAIRYDQNQIGYYDAVAEATNHGLLGEATNSILPEVFGPFISPGHYGGIKLTPALLKVVFASFMRIHEPYMQTSFQMHPDEGIAMDHTHKFSNSIYLTGRKGRVFTASLTATSLGGSIEFNRMTYTKCLSEVDLLYDQLKQSRLNAGQLLLKRFETDNVAGDQAFMERKFPELKDGVVPNQKGPGDCPKATIPKDEYTLLDTTSSVNSWAMAVISSDLVSNSSGDIYIGLDGEWNVGDSGMRMLQLSLPGHVIGLIDLQALGVYEDDKKPFPEVLKRLLELDCIVACGSQFGGDCGRLAKVGVFVRRRLDLKSAALACSDLQPHGTTLQGIVRQFLGYYLDKFGQQEDWSARPFKEDEDGENRLLQYAALDAHLSRKCGEELVRRLLLKPNGGLLETPKGLRCGQEAQLFHSGKVVASGIVAFIGLAGQQQTWGKATIGKGKALLQVKKVYVRGAAPPMSFTARGSNVEPSSLSWDKKRVNLGELLDRLGDDCLIGVRTSSLRIIVTEDAARARARALKQPLPLLPRLLPQRPTLPQKRLPTPKLLQELPKTPLLLLLWATMTTTPNTLAWRLQGGRQ